jgi:hypothetical protein
MSAWVSRHGARATRCFDRLEILKNLPASWHS